MADAQIDPRLAAVQLKGSDGSAVRLGDIWARQPAVIVWVRHFG